MRYGQGVRGSSPRCLRRGHTGWDLKTRLCADLGAPCGTQTVHAAHDTPHGAGWPPRGSPNGGTFPGQVGYSVL